MSQLNVEPNKQQSYVFTRADDAIYGNLEIAVSNRKSNIHKIPMPAELSTPIAGEHTSGNLSVALPSKQSAFKSQMQA